MIDYYTETSAPVCNTCDHCCADTEEDTERTEYWCSELKQMLTRAEVLNTFCYKWTFRKE